MKAHILQPYSQPDWPLIKRFQERWPDATVHSGGVPSLRYRTKIEFLAQLPRLFFYGLRIGLDALKGDKRPAAFVVGTDLEVLGLVLAQLLRRKRVPIFLIGFIYTVRKSRLATWCHARSHGWCRPMRKAASTPRRSRSSTVSAATRR